MMSYVNQNKQTHGAFNLFAQQKKAPNGFAELPDPDVVFVGGSGGNLGEIVAIAKERLAVGGRLVATTKLDRYLDKERPRYEADDEVDLMICAKTDLGFKAIVDGYHWGVIFHNEVFQRLDRGQEIKGYIKQVRPDGKIDLCLRKPGGKTLGGLHRKFLITWPHRKTVLCRSRIRARRKKFIASLA